MEDLLANIGLAHIRVVADPPYVALIDRQWWRVKEHDVLLKLCAREDIKVVHLTLEHADKRTPQVLQCSHAIFSRNQSAGRDVREEDVSHGH